MLAGEAVAVAARSPSPGGCLPIERSGSASCRQLRYHREIRAADHRQLSEPLGVKLRPLAVQRSVLNVGFTTVRVPILRRDPSMISQSNPRTLADRSSRCGPYAGPLRLEWQASARRPTDSAKDMIGILFTQRRMDSPQPPQVFTDFWTLAYGALQ
jgi:hypothetical protein